MSRRSPVSVLLLLGFLSACGDDPTGPVQQPGIHFPVGADVADTVDAVPVQAVRVQVRHLDGGAAAGEVVHVESLSQDQHAYPEMLVSQLGRRHFGTALVDTTNDDGVLHFQVKMGVRAGPARVVVTVPALGLQDTARFEVLPGSTASVAGLPDNLALKIGNTLLLDGYAVDRYLNRRPDPVTYSVEGSAATLAGRELTAVSFGRVQVAAHTEGGIWTIGMIGMVPDAVVAFNAFNANWVSTVYTAGLDGSDLTEVASTSSDNSYGSMTPEWITSSEMLYVDEGSSDLRPLYRLNLETGEHTRFLPEEEQMEIEHHARVTADRNWVFFSGGTDRGYWLYRKPLGGGPLERVSPEGLPLSHWTSAPSPDGSRVAYAEQGAWEDYFEVRQVSTGEVHRIRVSGEYPRWSPDGSLIAYVNGFGQLRVVRPDGTGDRLLTSEPIHFVRGVDWSPDGAFVVAGGPQGTLTVVEVATGIAVSAAVPSLASVGTDISSLAWRPGAE